MAQRKHISERALRSQGTKDGRDWIWKPWRPFPGWPMWEKRDPTPMPEQENTSHFEENLISWAKENLKLIADLWKGEDEKYLRREYCSAKAQLAALGKDMDRESKEYQNAVQPCETAKSNFLTHASQWIPIQIYYVIFFIITAGEGYFNYFVFQMFGEDKVGTAVMAAAIIVIMPLASELNGHFLKKDEKTAMDKAFIIGSLTAVASLMIVLAVLRESFFESTQAAAGSTMPMTPTTLAFVLIVFNLAIFVVLTFLSYAESRKDPENYRRTRDQFRMAKEDLKKQIGDVNKLDPALKQAIERYTQIQARRQAAFEKYQSLAERERDAWVAHIRIYRHANVSTRREYKEIVSFKADPGEKITTPEPLKEISWECDHG